MQIKNRKTKEVREVTEAGWAKIEKNDLINDWSVIQKTKTPPEVETMAAKKAEAAADNKKADK